MPELNLAVDHVAIWRCWPKTLLAFARYGPKLHGQPRRNILLVNVCTSNVKRTGLRTILRRDESRGWVLFESWGVK